MPFSLQYGGPSAGTGNFTNPSAIAKLTTYIDNYIKPRVRPNVGTSPYNVNTYCQAIDKQQLSIIIPTTKDGATKGPSGYLIFRLASFGGAGSNTLRLNFIATTQAYHAGEGSNSGLIMLILAPDLDWKYWIRKF